MMKCPCKDCICIPICRNKPYHDLFDDCYLLEEYEHNPFEISRRDADKIKKLKTILKPACWIIRRKSVLRRIEEDEIT